MREAPLTDKQKSEKGMYGSYASRVRGREVTAQSENELSAKRGEAAMNSTATELEFTRRSAMREIVKGFVVGTLGLAWLLVPVGYVYAAPIDPKTCDTQRYIVCSDGACGSRKCYCNNKVLTPGETCTKTLGGKTYFYMCDGCTGKVGQVIKRQPTLPQLTPAVPPSRVTPAPGGTLQKSP